MFPAPLWMPVHTLMLLQHSTGLLSRLLCARFLHLYELSSDVSAVLRYAAVSGHSSVVYVPFQMLHASHVLNVPRWLSSLSGSSGSSRTLPPDKHGGTQSFWIVLMCSDALAGIFKSLTILCV